MKVARSTLGNSISLQERTSLKGTAMVPATITKERFNNILDIPSDAIGIYESRSLERVRLRITFTTIRMNGCGRVAASNLV
jgi:hypothetical protein